MCFAYPLKHDCLVLNDTILTFDFFIVCVNRFSKDIYTIDEQIPQTVLFCFLILYEYLIDDQWLFSAFVLCTRIYLFETICKSFVCTRLLLYFFDTFSHIFSAQVRGYLSTMAKVTGILLYISIVTPLFIVGLAPICVLYFLAQRYYIETSRELTRLENTSRSPIYALFSETLDGLSTIRAYNCEKRLVQVSVCAVFDYYICCVLCVMMLVYTFYVFLAALML